MQAVQAQHSAGARVEDDTVTQAPERPVPAADLAAIRASMCWLQNRVTVVHTSAGPVVVKGQRPPRGSAARRFLRLCAIPSGLPLQNAPVHGGAAAQEVELRRLRQLRGAELPVPRVLHEDPDFFVLEYVPGPNLAEKLTEAPDLALWMRAARVIQHAHGMGQYFSQAFARNFIVGPHGLDAIDFEDDPLEVMGLAEAQTRDWLMFLQSTVWLLGGQRQALMDLWLGLLRDESADVVALLDKTARRLAWLRGLPEKRRPWGRDVVSVQGAAAFLAEWRRRVPPR